MFFDHILLYSYLCFFCFVTLIGTNASRIHYKLYIYIALGEQVPEKCKRNDHGCFVP